MSTIDEAIMKSKALHEYTKDLIERSDINVIYHYWFENLEEMILDELNDYIQKHPLPYKPTKQQCEFILRDIWKYTFAWFEKEKVDFHLYHLPDFISDLYFKLNKDD